MNTGYTPATGWYTPAPTATTTPEQDIMKKLASVSDPRGLAYVALILAIMAIAGVATLAVCLCKLRRNQRDGRSDAERSVGLNTVPRRAPSPEDGPQRPRQARVAGLRSPVGTTPADARGRPVAAYTDPDNVPSTRLASDFETARVHGESESYFSQSRLSTARLGSPPVSSLRTLDRRPTYSAGSGLGEQTEGADYARHARSPRWHTPHRTNTNDANYGRRGNKFVHGT